MYKKILINLVIVIVAVALCIAFYIGNKTKSNIEDNKSSIISKEKTDLAKEAESRGQVYTQKYIQDGDFTIIFDSTKRVEVKDESRNYDNNPLTIEEVNELKNNYSIKFVDSPECSGTNIVGTYVFEIENNEIYNYLVIKTRREARALKPPVKELAQKLISLSQEPACGYIENVDENKLKISEFLEEYLNTYKLGDMDKINNILSGYKSLLKKLNELSNNNDGLKIMGIRSYDDRFAFVTVDVGQTSFPAIMGKTQAGWVKIYSGNGIPACEEMDKFEIPSGIYGGCSLNGVIRIESKGRYWHNYYNYDLGFGILMPNNILVYNYCHNKNEVGEVYISEKLKTFIENDTVHFWPGNTYREGGVCAIMNKNSSSWKIVRGFARNEKEIDAFVRSVYGCGYKDMKESAQEGLFDINLDFSNWDPEGECFVNYAHVIKYSPVVGKIFTWAIGQDNSFVENSDEYYGYDGDMVESFRVLQ